MQARHLPVMTDEVLEFLKPRPGGLYLDATVGAGGHTMAMLDHAGGGCTVIGLDRDEAALAIARERIGERPEAILRKSRFSELGDVVRGLGIEGLDGVLFDLGLSMMQLKDEGRGFSFMADERLDMRMDPSEPLSAWNVVNEYAEQELERIIREYGEERYARRVARTILRRRASADINSCSELAGIVASAVGYSGRIHPATRTFQAIRIEVNREIEELGAGLAQAVTCLRPGGRLVVIAYHSVEDREVKRFIRQGRVEGRLLMLTKKPLVPGSGELGRNPSARSAKLRAAEAI